MKPENIVELLKSFEVFSHSSEKELIQLSSFVYWRTYRKGQMLFTAGDPRERIYLLVDGFVKLEKNNSDATLLYSDYIKPNTLFPYGGLFSDPDYHYSAIAVTDVELLYLPTFYFEDTVKRSKKHLLHVVRELSSILRLHETRLQKMTNSNATERVIHTISYLMEDLGSQEGDVITLRCPITTTDISNISGTSRETVSHVINDLKKNNILSFTYKKMTIHDQQYFQLESS
ncbi:Crp/Fnr family transcriptional regulator [Bacillus sp. 7504-2]|nr:Crp/Fnr family transcriptional regulator [Bacillus sp. 7504-2]